MHSYLLGSVAPRPICFASTIDSEGNANLSPFSFFNVFGSKPPILIFSPARRVRDNTIKHTLENVYDTKEVVINIVNYSIVQQASLSSCEYPKGTDEFVKSGLTALKSDIVKPFRVKESPVQFEVVCMHIDDHVLDEHGRIDPHKIDLVARMGADYYCRASGSAIFEVAKPNMELGMGVDALPQHIRSSNILTGNSLGMLGNSKVIPTVAAGTHTNERLAQILRDTAHDEEQKREQLHLYAQELLSEGDVDMAWQVLLAE